MDPQPIYILFVFLAQYNAELIPKGINECIYEQEACQINVETCLDYEYKNEETRFGCGANAKHSTVYKGRNTTSFTSEFVDSSSGNYTWSVMSDEDGIASILKSCCNLPLLKTCELRPQRESESLYVLIQKREAGKTALVCKEEVLEVAPKKYMPWCDIEHRLPCINITREGVFKVQRRLVDTSIRKFSFNQEFHLFEAPREYANGGVVLGGRHWLKSNIQEIKMGESAAVAYIDGKAVSTTPSVPTDKVDKLVQNLAQSCKMWCFFTVYNEYASCFVDFKNSPVYQGNCDSWWIAIIVAATLLAVGIGMFIVSRYAVKKLKYCVLDPSEAEKDIPTATKDIVLGDVEKCTPQRKSLDQPIPFKVDDVAYRSHEKNNNSAFEFDDVVAKHRLTISEESDVAMIDTEILSNAIDDEALVLVPDIDTSTNIPVDQDGYSKKTVRDSESGMEFVDSGLGTIIDSGLSSNRSVGSDYREGRLASSALSSTSEESSPPLKPSIHMTFPNDEGIDTNEPFETEVENTPNDIGSKHEINLEKNTAEQGSWLDGYSCKAMPEINNLEHTTHAVVLPNVTVAGGYMSKS